MDKALKIKEMETQSVPKLIAKYSFFTFCALFFNELYNIVDTLFVSRGVGDNAMGGVSIIFPFVMVQGAIAQTVGSGAASIVTRLLGKKDYEKAGSVTANAMFLFYIMSILITIAGLTFINPLLRLFGATQDIMPYAKEYFTIMLIGNVFSTGFSSIIRAEGKMLYGLMIWIIPTAINVALDAVFIYGIHMGVRGAALATVISYFTSFVMSVIFFTKISVQKFRRIRIQINTIIDIITIGIPMLIQLGSISLLFMIINRVLSTVGGTQEINTFAYISKVTTFAIVPFNAISTAASPIISYNCGAGKKSRINQCVRYSIIFCEIYGITALAAAILTPEIFIRIFTSDINIVTNGAKALRIISASLIFVPFTVITGSYFQAVGKKIPAFITNILIVFYAVIIIIVLSGTAGINGIWVSIPISCILAGISSIILIWKIKQR